MSRREMLLAAAVVMTTGCARILGLDVPPPRPTTPAPRSLPTPEPWRPGVGELVPAAKLAAVRRIEALGNHANLRLDVIDAQYGGLLKTTASVLVVCRDWTIRNRHIVSGGTTYDVRVAQTNGSWTVTAIHPSEPGPPARLVSAAAHQVLASDRIALPPAARADIASGAVHDSVLHAMLSVARQWRIDVSVVRSGHPHFVFGTDRPSDHPRGRAFDTWRIDGHPVVSPNTPQALVRAYMEALAGAGSYNVGGPIQLGAAPRYFSDRTHHDHVHAGFAH